MQAADTHRATQIYFDQRASRYWSDLYEGPATNHYQLLLRRRRDLVVELLKDLEGPALELGCGPGVLADVLASKGALFVGDISFNMVKHAMGRVGHGGVQMSAAALPFRDCSLQLVTAIGVLEYVSDENLSLREIYRVLGPFGAAVITFPARKPLEDIFRRVARLAALPAQAFTAQRLAAAAPVASRVGEHWAGEARRMLQQAGLHVEEMRSFHYFYFPWSRLSFGGSRVLDGVLSWLESVFPATGLIAQSWVFKVRKA